ncbi:MAG: SAM-dependent methyltransferase [Rhodospirillaceae bacterium]|nr:SAM-dependent methyltransferase [Rhodospirillaceae bacterium]|tara:strand:+ start:4638 stop:5279 length:642 start_codon:yes stop_codon:yes gene_type:complete
MPGPVDHDWLKQGSTSSADVRQSYENWAGSYDQDLSDWDYRAPLDAALLLKSHTSVTSKVLDAGCGTGLVGTALRRVGFTGDITGIDLSPTSLEKAEERGVYRDLQPVDFQQLPLALSDDTYDALTCVGVLTYVLDSEAILKEFARLVRPGGITLVTQRNDLFQERAFDRTIQELVDERVYKDPVISDPKLYLPGNPDFGSDIQVIYAILTVA